MGEKNESKVRTELSTWKKIAHKYAQVCVRFLSAPVYLAVAQATINSNKTFSIQTQVKTSAQRVLPLDLMMTKNHCYPNSLDYESQKKPRIWICVQLLWSFWLLLKWIAAVSLNHRSNFHQQRARRYFIVTSKLKTIKHDCLSRRHVNLALLGTLWRRCGFKSRAQLGVPGLQDSGGEIQTLSFHKRCRLRAYRLCIWPKELC